MDEFFRKIMLTIDGHIEYCVRYWYSSVHTESLFSRFILANEGHLLLLHHVVYQYQFVTSLRGKKMKKIVFVHNGTKCLKGRLSMFECSVLLKTLKESAISWYT